ncbi:Inactive C-alpha-formylglycine-proteinrating enzyme 2 [Branchiostoma belcheri]|nr:Inactive C-alpha-formylglycine-proteinrating enzyme 2 [Branchiostoma belcheri]
MYAWSSGSDLVKDPSGVYPGKPEYSGSRLISYRPAKHIYPRNTIQPARVVSATEEPPKQAARGGSFPDNNTLEDGHFSTSSVLAFPEQNDYGMYDVVGNVWEWTSSQYVPPGMRKEEADERKYVVRGGSWLDSKDGSFNYRVQVTTRKGQASDIGCDHVGFRCAQSVVPTSSDKVRYVSKVNLTNQAKRPKVRHLKDQKKKKRPPPPPPTPAPRRTNTPRPRGKPRKSKRGKRNDELLHESHVSYLVTFTPGSVSGSRPAHRAKSDLFFQRRHPETEATSKRTLHLQDGPLSAARSDRLILTENLCGGGQASIVDVEGFSVELFFPAVFIDKLDTQTTDSPKF